MTAINVNELDPRVTPVTRAAMVIVALYVALAIGAPWLLNDAPPSAQDVLAANVFCEPGAANRLAATQ